MSRPRDFATHTSPTVAILLGIGAGVVVGLVNGLVVTVLRINSLIATLAMAFIVGGIGTRITNGNLLVLFDRPAFGNFAQTEFLTGQVVDLDHGDLGRRDRPRARPGDRRAVHLRRRRQPSAALLAGVPVNSIRVLAFVVSGAAAGLAGVVDTSRVLSAQASTGDVSLTFAVLAGIVVGGTSILGGEGAVWQTVVGVLFIALIANGYELQHYNVLYEQITLGVILIAAVSLDSWTRAESAPDPVPGHRGVGCARAANDRAAAGDRPPRRVDPRQPYARRTRRSGRAGRRTSASATSPSRSRSRTAFAGGDADAADQRL